MACSAASTPPFMSTAPRPCTQPPSTAPDHGPWRHVAVPGPTTSTWPLRHSRPGTRPGSVTVSPSSSVRAASSPGWPGWARRAARSCSTSSAASPSAAARPASQASAARSSPVTLGIRTSAATSRASASGSRLTPATSPPAPAASSRARCARARRARSRRRPARRAAPAGRRRRRSSSGISAPSKSEPRQTASTPATSATCAAWAAITASGVSGSSRPSARTKPTWKGMPTTPPDAPTARSCSSVRLRGDGHSAWAPECEATSGAPLRPATSQNPRSFRWERSTTMPSSPHASTSARPAAVRPGPWSGEPGKSNGTPVANAFGRLQTRPRERSPAAWSTASASSAGSIGSAPSRWSTAASPGPSRSAAVARDAEPPARRALDADEERGLGERLRQGVALVDRPGVVDLVRVLLAVERAAGEDGEAAARQPAGLRAREVEVAAVVAVDEAADGVAAGGEEPREDVVVAVEGRQPHAGSVAERRMTRSNVGGVRRLSWRLRHEVTASRPQPGATTGRSGQACAGGHGSGSASAASTQYSAAGPSTIWRCQALASRPRRAAASSAWKVG